MSGFLDTSVIVRYLVADSPDLAKQAASIIEKAEDLLVTDGVLAEVGYVLTTVYRLPRETVVDHLMALLRRQNIAAYGVDKGLLLQGLLMCRPSGRVSFSDATLWAVARSSHSPVVYTLDERFPQDGINVRRQWSEQA